MQKRFDTKNHTDNLNRTNLKEHNFGLPLIRATNKIWMGFEGCNYRIHWFDGDVTPRIDVVKDDTIEDSGELFFILRGLVLFCYNEDYICSELSRETPL